MMKACLLALVLLASTGYWAMEPGIAAAQLSPPDAASLARQLASAVATFPPAAAVSTVEAELALLIEQSRVGDEAAIAAIEIVLATPGLPANAKEALENLLRLIKGRKHKNNIGALGNGGVGAFGNGGPGFVGGGGSDYHN